jgi:glutathione synthase
MQTKKLGIIMDPIAQIKVHKDTSFAMLLEAQRRGFEIYYFELKDLFLDQGVAKGLSRRLTVKDDPNQWFTLSSPEKIALGELDILLMRKDPPFDAEYIYATYILERAQAAGALVVNNPQSLRDANEKLFTAWFAQCTPPTLVSRSHDLLLAFLAEHNEVVFKPPEGMGGSRVFYVKKGDINTNVILETLTQHQTHYIIAQRFIPEITRGDKRILMIDGEPVPYALARIPHQGDLRGNLVAGASYEGRELTERDRWICSQVGPTLREKGLLFVGLDVIGDYLTEINVTSPTCVRELDHIYNLNIAGLFFDVLEKRIS